LVAQCMRNRDHGAQAWQFVKDNWQQMLQAYPDNAMVRMLDGFKLLSQPEVAADIAAFFDNHSVPVGELTLQQHLEKLRVNVALREREAERLAGSLLG
ncbi:MAG: ERAP1-like C-terminal domain-containing protein, partial [bacterium]|nr:ERAP1-like C-terminal domain-containing protein [bacterium]